MDTRVVLASMIVILVNGKEDGQDMRATIKLIVTKVMGTGKRAERQSCSCSWSIDKYYSPWACLK